MAKSLQNRCQIEIGDPWPSGRDALFNARCPRIDTQKANEVANEISLISGVWSLVQAGYSYQILPIIW